MRSDGLGKPLVGASGARHAGHPRVAYHPPGHPRAHARDPHPADDSKRGAVDFRYPSQQKLRGAAAHSDAVPRRFAASIRFCYVPLDALFWPPLQVSGVKMRQRVLRAGLAIVSAMTLSAAAHAQPNIIASSRFQAWSLSSHRSDATGQFNHCAASARYQSGVMLLFAVNSRFEWTMGFASNDWRLQPGARIPVTFAIDGLPPRSATATAVNSGQVVVPMPDDPQLFQQMRAGHRMVVVGGGQTVGFNLTHTSVVLSTLLRCVNENGRSITVQAPQAAPRPSIAATPSTPRAEPTAPPSGAASAEMRVEATQFVANLLSHAGMRGFRILTRSDLQGDSVPPFVRASDVAWRGETSVGTLHIHPNVDPRDLDRLAADIIAADARACPGEFITGRTADPDMTNVRRLHTFCARPGGAVETVSYILLPMPGRLAYQLSTASPLDRNDAASEDQRLRDAVHAAVSRHPAFGPSSQPPRAQEPATRPAGAPAERRS